MKAKPHTTEISEEELIERLGKVARESESTMQLVDAALKGLIPSIHETIKKIDGYDLDGKMAKAEQDIAGMIIEVAKQDAEEMAGFQNELEESEAEEAELLADDEKSPEELA